MLVLDNIATAPKSQMFDQTVGHPQTVNPSHLSYLPPSQFLQPPNVYVPITGKINCDGQLLSPTAPGV